MPRPAIRNDIPTLVRHFKDHHTEKGFAFPFNAARVSLTLARAIEDANSIVLVSPNGLLYGVCYESDLGAGMIASERIVRGNLHIFRLEFEKWARSKRCATVTFSCTDRFDAFARLYRKHGYTISETTFSKVL